MKALSWLLVLVMAAVNVNFAVAADDGWIEQFDRLCNRKQLDEANELLLDKFREAVAVKTGAPSSDIGSRTASLSRIVTRAYFLMDEGAQYRAQFVNLRDKYLEEVERSNYCRDAKPMIKAIMLLNVVFGDTARSLAVYHKIRAEDRNYFDIDNFVFEGLWSEHNYDAIASSPWPRRLLKEDKRIRSGNGETEAIYRSRTYHKNLQAVAMQIVALRKVGLREKADKLEKDARDAFDEKDLVAAETKLDQETGAGSKTAEEQ